MITSIDEKMKINENQLRDIVKETITNILRESYGNIDADMDALEANDTMWDHEDDEFDSEGPDFTEFMPEPEAKPENKMSAAKKKQMVDDLIRKILLKNGRKADDAALARVKGIEEPEYDGTESHLISHLKEPTSSDAEMMGRLYRNDPWKE